jgi:UDP-2,3-diacylglucosamine pyrophosphatase LpxH
MSKRKVDIAVISDVHLGTYGCQAKELVKYLKSIDPDILILNGDIIDIWQFRKRYFPKAHLKVLKQIMNIVSRGRKVYYLTGNHDEMLRKFTDFNMGGFHLADKLVLKIGDKKAWFFHGDIFDVSIQNAKWIAKLGGWGYDLLILINSIVNWVLIRMGKEKYSLSKKIKNSVKKAVKYISDFEDTAAELAIDKGYDYVVCGHIHQPQVRRVLKDGGHCIYLNSGDWVENLTALENHGGEWVLYQYADHHYHSDDENEDERDEWDVDIMSLVKKVTDTDLEIVEEENSLRRTGNG